MRTKKCTALTATIIATLGFGCGESPENITFGSDSAEDTETGSSAVKDAGTDTESSYGEDDAGADTETATDTDADTQPEPFDSDTSKHKRGICGLKGEAVVTSEKYEGTEELYLIGDDGDGDDVCRIRFDVRSIGTPSIPCDLCQWTFTVRMENRTILTHRERGCDSSYFSENAVSADATRSMGYVTEYAGHTNVLMILDENSDKWTAVGVASYNEDTGDFSYKRSDGFCEY